MEDCTIIKEDCIVCKRNLDIDAMFPLMIIRDSIWDTLIKDIPTASKDSYICQDDFHRYRVKYIHLLLEKERGTISEADKEVLNSLKSMDIITTNTNEIFEETLTLGEKVADKVSEFGGSWKFIFLFFSFLIGWMIINTVFLLNNPYDPYPYILLNLILSCLAAVQAPIIMMAQNRRAERDRMQAEQDYKVNLQSELQIRNLNLKLDKFISTQWNKS